MLGVDLKPLFKLLERMVVALERIAERLER